MITAIANQKGGVGKTTLAVHLAVWLSDQEQKTILVDADPQGNATSWLATQFTNSGLWDLVNGRKARLWPIEPYSHLALIASNHQTADAFSHLTTTHAPITTLRNALQPYRTLAQHVIIDMPPSRSAGFLSLLYAADQVLMPATMERLAVEGIALMADDVAAMKTKHGYAPQLLGIVPNMIRRTNEHKAYLTMLTKAHGAVIWPPIPQSIRFAEACALGTTLFDHAPKATVTRAITLVCKRYQENSE